MWSPPCPIISAQDVVPTSSPKVPVFLGPDINNPPEYPTPFGFEYTQRLHNPSQNIEPVTPALLPESWTLIPANLTAGVSVFNITVFVPILTALAVIFCNEDEP